MRWTMMILAATLAACGSDNTEPVVEAPVTVPETQESVTEAPGIDVPAAEAAPLTGTYCYFSDTATETEGMIVTLNENGTAEGRHFGTIHDEASAYYASFEVTLSNGQPTVADVFSFDAVVEVDGDTQEGSVDWVIRQDSANELGNDKPLATADCDGLEDRIWPPVEE